MTCSLPHTLDLVSPEPKNHLPRRFELFVAFLVASNFFTMAAERLGWNNQVTSVSAAWFWIVFLRVGLSGDAQKEWSNSEHI